MSRYIVVIIFSIFLFSCASKKNIVEDDVKYNYNYIFVYDEYIKSDIIYTEGDNISNIINNINNIYIEYPYLSPDIIFKLFVSGNTTSYIPYKFTSLLKDFYKENYKIIEHMPYWFVVLDVYLKVYKKLGYKKNEIDFEKYNRNIVNIKSYEDYIDYLDSLDIKNLLSKNSLEEEFLFDRKEIEENFYKKLILILQKNKNLLIFLDRNHFKNLSFINLLNNSQAKYKILNL